MPYPKIVAYAPCGGKATLSQLSEMVSGGAVNLSQEEADQYQRAKLMAAPANGGDLAAAKTYLEQHEWTVYWDGPAPNDSRLELRIPGDLKTWVLANGGSDMVRRLIEAARERQEAEAPTN